MNARIDIDMNRRCDVCDNRGACQNGMCLACVTKYLIQGKPMPRNKGFEERAKLRKWNEQARKGSA